MLLGGERKVRLGASHLIPLMAKPGGSGFGSCHRTLLSPTGSRTLQTHGGNLLPATLDRAAADEVALAPAWAVYRLSHR